MSDCTHESTYTDQPYAFTEKWYIICGECEYKISGPYLHEGNAEVHENYYHRQKKANQPDMQTVRQTQNEPDAVTVYRSGITGVDARCTNDWPNMVSVHRSDKFTTPTVLIEAEEVYLNAERLDEFADGLKEMAKEMMDKEIHG